MRVSRNIFKKLIQPFANLRYKLKPDKYSVEGLKEGVSAVVVAKNESYCISPALESLIGFADEIVCIDNGSTDDTLKQMNRFKDDFAGKAIIEVIEAPGKLLADCRNLGLGKSHFIWHLRWDADMVFRQKIGQYNAVTLREEIMKIKKPVAIKLPRINLSGDFHHVSKLYPVID